VAPAHRLFDTEQQSEREKKAVEQSSAPATRETTNRPWSETQAVITSTEGTVTGVSAESLANCISANKELTLSSGQSIAFEMMRSFEFVRESSKTTLVVTLLSGETVKGSMNSMTMACDLIGQNQLGRVSVLFEKLKRVDFQR
jgi:hypothetical protein